MDEYIKREAVLAWKYGGVVDVADIKEIPEAEVIPVSVMKRAISGIDLADQCDQAGRYEFRLRNALKTVLEWYGSPDYLEHEKRTDGR